MKKNSVFGMALLVLLGVSQTAAAEEELAPGFDACMEKSGGVTADLRMCLNEAYEYWDAALNENYAAAMKLCDETADPKACKNKLRSAERLWVQYKTAMADALAELGGDGSLSLIISSDFLARETKKQALELDAGE